MKHRHPFLHALLALASSVTAGIAADAPAPAAPPANVQIQIQGGGQLQIQGGGQIQFQLNGVRVQAAAGVVQPDTITPRFDLPPVIFFPGIPSILLPNPAALADAKPGFLGLQLDTTGDEPADDAGEKKDPAKKIAGVGILNVVEDSPAEKAGLKEADRVLTLEGREAKTSAQLREMIRALKPGQDVKMTVRREGKEIEIKAKLAAAPDVPAPLQVLGQNEPQAVPGVVVFNYPTFIARSSTGAIGGTSTSVPNDKDTVSLRDGNRFTGKIRGIDPAKGLLFQREGLPDLELIEEEIAGLTLAEREKAAAPPAAKGVPAHAKVLLQLRDGGVLNGDVLTMDRDALLLTMRGQERMEIPREHVQSVTFSDEQGVQMYDGPSGLTGWSSGRYPQGQWEYKDGLLRCITNGPIGRTLGRMPDPVDMSFDVVFPRHMQHFGVALFGSGVNESGVGGLTVQFSPNQIYGIHFDGRRSNQYSTPLKPAERVNFSDKPESIRYRLLVDRVNGRALIYINGVKRAEWTLSKVKPVDLGKCGGAFSLTPHVSMADVAFQFGRVRLLPWNGREPDGKEGLPASKGDLLLAGDGTETGGSIERITDGEIVFAKPAATVLRDKALFVRFAPPATPKESPAAAAKVRMKNGSEFSAAQVRGDGESMTFTTRFGPEITVPFSALRDLEFLPRAGQGEVSAKRTDVLTLTDGTQFRGRAITPIAGERVGWKIAASKAPLDFASANVAGIFFSNADEPRKSAPLKGDSAVHLANGDWLPGDVVSLDAKHLVLNTGLSPELNIPLDGLRSIFLNPAVSAAVGDGATGKDLWSEGWNPNRAMRTGQRVNTAAKTASPWMYHDGSYTPTPAARSGQTMLAHHWPAYAGAYALNLEVANPGRGPSFSIQIYNSKDERTFSISAGGGRVYVNFNPSTVRLNRFAVGGKRFQVEEKVESTGGISRVTIVLDRPARTFRVFMAGKEVGKIAFKEDEANEALDIGGMSLTTTSYSATGGMQNRVTRIWLAPWDGTSPATKKEKVAAEGEAKNDAAPPPVIHLMNGDEFAGGIEKLTADLVTVNSDAGPLELPGKRVAWIHFPGTTAADAVHFPRLRFHDRGLLSVQDLQIGTERVKCKTLQGQSLEFPLSVVKEAVWRPLADK